MTRNELTASKWLYLVAERKWHEWYDCVSFAEFAERELGVSLQRVIDLIAGLSPIDKLALSAWTKEEHSAMLDGGPDPLGLRDWDEIHTKADND